MPRVAEGGTVLIYETVPTKAVVGFFTVKKVVRLPLPTLWSLARGNAELTKEEFLSYFDGLTEGAGILVRKAVRFSRPIDLAELRTLWPGFQPPQGFRYLNDEALQSLYAKTECKRRAA